MEGEEIVQMPQSGVMFGFACRNCFIRKTITLVDLDTGTSRYRLMPISAILRPSEWTQAWVQDPSLWNDRVSPLSWGFVIQQNWTVPVRLFSFPFLSLFLFLFLFYQGYKNNDITSFRYQPGRSTWDAG
jgi:hypothetical protein